MKILMVHNHYQQPGGEDQVFASEAHLLETYGHQVVSYAVYNDQVEGLNPIVLAANTVWNRSAYYELRSLIRRERPQIAHFHNTLPLISPAAYYAAAAEGVPVVQTLHNYRLLCANGVLFRDNHVCEECLGKSVPWPGVIHACYRGSRAATGVVATMLTLHRTLRTWTNVVDLYIVLTEFARQKFIQGGLQPEKLVVKSNFVHYDPGFGEGLGGYALFVGRLSAEKGIGTLLASWEQLGKKIPLKIVGDGPLASQVAEVVRRVPGVEWLGQKPVEEVYTLMGGASMLILPSEWYETFGRVAIEAFAKGTPVITANIGAIAELVEPDRTGLHFHPGDPKDLATQVEWTLTHPAEFAKMRQEARAEYKAKYTAEQNYRLLMEIYERVVGSGFRRLPSPPVVS